MIHANNSPMDPVCIADANAPMNIVRLVLIGLTAFLTVVDLFAVQALLPTLTDHYRVAPSAMGLAVNACTFGMAVGGVSVALIGQRVDRRLGIVVSLILLAVPTVLLAFAPNLWIFASLRILQGLCMATAFGLMLAHLGEHLSAKNVTAAFAAYITGNVSSNLVGRFIAASVVDHISLEASFYVFASLNMIGAVLVWFTLKRAPHVNAYDKYNMTVAEAWRAHLRNRRLLAAFGIGFCILFAFIGTFTYVNFILVMPPHSVGMMHLGIIYFVFLPSIFTTPTAGKLTDRLGTQRALWTCLAMAGLALPLLLSSWLPAVLFGMTLIASGTFAAQAIATGYVSHAAEKNRVAAGGLYLAAYFTGGLVGSAVLGALFDGFGWPTAVAGIAVALGVAAMLTTKLKALD